METTHDTIGETEALDAMIAVVAQNVASEVVGRCLDDDELAQIRTRINGSIELGLQAVRSALRMAMTIETGRSGNSPDKLTPPELARRWRISPDKVLNWIRSGELRAMNAATKQTGRPRYLVDPSDVEAFEARRTVQQAPKSPRRKRHTNDDVIEFF